MEASQKEVLRFLEPTVQRLIDSHLVNQNLWMPSELLHPGGYTHERSVQLKIEANDVPLAARAVLVLNALTEAGLPHFHRLLAQYLGEDTNWRVWTDLWTAEEDRHDGVLHDYIRETRLVDVGEVERLQYQYLMTGFRPEWNQDCSVEIIDSY